MFRGSNDKKERYNLDPPKLNNYFGLYSVQIIYQYNLDGAGD